MTDKLMNIPNDDKLKYPYIFMVETLNSQLNELNSIKVPRLLMKQIRKCYYKALGTSVINSQMSLSSLGKGMSVCGSQG